MSGHRTALLLWGVLAGAQGLSVRTSQPGPRIAAVVPAGQHALELRIDGRKTAFAVEADGPAEAVVVIDAVNSSPDEMLRSERALEDWLTAQGATLAQSTSVLWVLPGKGDAGSVAAGGVSVHRLPATRNGSMLLGQVRAYERVRVQRQDGGTDPAGRVRLSLAALSFIAAAETAQPGVKVVVWMSPGWPYLARAQSPDGLFNTVVSLSQSLQQAGMLLKMVDPAGVVSGDRSADEAMYLTQPRSPQGGDMRPREIAPQSTPEMWRQYERPPQNATETNPNDLLLQVLAVQSGGQVLRGSNDVLDQLRRAVQDCARVMLLRVQLDDGVPEQYRAVELKGAVRVRPGFYGR